MLVNAANKGKCQVLGSFLRGCAAYHVNYLAPSEELLYRQIHGQNFRQNSCSPIHDFPPEYRYFGNSHFFVV